jgi:tetratricopeptide (TPR) repeat protein
MAADPATYKINQADVPKLISEGFAMVDQITKRDPDYITVALEAPVLYLVQGPSDPANFAKAQASFDALTNKYPNYEYLYLFWGRILTAVKHYDEAIAVLDALAAKSSRPPHELTFWQGYVGIVSGKANRQSIVGDLQEAVQNNVGFAIGDETALRNTVIYLLNINEFQTAAYFEKALLDIQPNNAQEHVRLSYIDSQLGLLDDAVAEARKAVQLDSSMTDTVKSYLQVLGRSL